MTDDSDPQDYENMDVEKYFKEDDEPSIDVISVNTENVEGYVPIEELEALADEFESGGEVDTIRNGMEEAAQEASDWCARSLRELIAEYGDRDE